MIGARLSPTAPMFPHLKSLVVAVIILSVAPALANERLKSPIRTSSSAPLAQPSKPYKPAKAAKPIPTKPGDIQTGWLEVVWGDPMEEQVQGLTRVVLVGEQGQRKTLDTQQALRAAEDLYDLAGKQVAVASDPSHPMKLDAMVGVEDLLRREPRDNPRPPAEPTYEIHQWVTLACKFPDSATLPATINELSSHYSRMRGRMGDYWHTMSYGKINLKGRAHGWFELPSRRADYLTGGTLNHSKLANDCIEAAQGHVDFSQAHGINMFFNMSLDGRAWGGRHCGAVGMPQRCMPTTWMPSSTVKSRKIWAHEMGHAYGMPHSDNSDGDNDTYDNVWDNMSGPGWTRYHPLLGSEPIYTTGWHRRQRGWIPPERIATVMEGMRTTQLFYLDSATDYSSTGKHMVILRAKPPRDREGNIPQPEMGVHYALEARTGGHFDHTLPGQAVIIHRIQHGSFSQPFAVDADTPPANRNNNEGSMFKPGESWTPPERLGTVRILGRTKHGFLISVGPVR